MHTARPISELRRELASGELAPRQIIENALITARWRREQGAKTYIHLDPEAVRVQLDGALDLQAPLGGLPLSVKDCFDVALQPSTAGSGFFAGTRSIPTEDAWLVQQARAAGAILMGKTNLNEFAYGITGENQHHGNVQVPSRPGCLTGGSSSGAAASVAEGSAVIGLGTDTGGSLRAPASFCGLVSLRPTHGTGNFAGCFPLAQSFDTMGFLIRHLADTPLVAAALLSLKATVLPDRTWRIGIPEGSWLEGCEEDVLQNLAQFGERLRGVGLETTGFDADPWNDAPSMFVPIQAHEAFANHRELLPKFADQYDPGVRARIEFGGTIDRVAYERYQGRRAEFTAAQGALFERFDFLTVPISPLRELEDGTDLSGFRSRILTLTTPASVCGWPVLTLRGQGNSPEDESAHGRGIGIMARGGGDGALLALASWLAERGF